MVDGSSSNIVSQLPVRRGHFGLESGYHACEWFDLDLLFYDTEKASQLAGQLADRLAPHAPDVICGAMTGGAFLAQLVAIRLGRQFVFTARREEAAGKEQFAVPYELPVPLAKVIKGRRIAFVDDAVSTGSATRGSIKSIHDCGATTVVVGSIIQFGQVGVDYLKQALIPVETLLHHDYQTWHPDDCPLCLKGETLTLVRD